MLLGAVAVAQTPMLASNAPAVNGGLTLSERAPEVRQPEYHETEHIRTFYERSRF